MTAAAAGRGRVRLVGLDPGLRRTGWGVVEAEGNALRHLADGVVASDARAPIAERLAALHEGLIAALSAWDADEAAVEETFVNRNAASALKLGEARGAALLAAARLGLPVAEYAPNLVKKSLVGAGHADKAQVAAMVRMLLPGCLPKGADAADALAVAVCHAHHLATRRRWAAGGAEARA